jgi:DNA-directed RNA polymerase specialized sigma24 family protein
LHARIAPPCSSLFERHYARISGFFSGLALDDEVTDQLTVETFLTAWESASNFHRDSPVSIWLLALGNRCVLRRYGRGDISRILAPVESTMKARKSGSTN